MSKHHILLEDNVVDNLTSTSTTAPLSANQGKVLNKSKVAIAQGVSEAGKFLKVGADGNVTTGSGGGVSDYDDLSSRPQVNSVTLTGNKSSEELNIVVNLTKAQYDALGSAEKMSGKIFCTTDESSSDVVWGDITGILSNQTDLEVALTGKQATANLVTSWQETPDDTHYPSEKLVKDNIDSKVVINQGAVNAGKYMIVGSDGNITPSEFRKVYGIRIPYGATTSNIEYTDFALGMDETQRRALVRSWAKHAVVQNGSVKYWLNPSNLSQKADGTTATLDGTDGDVMLMYRPIWWKVTHVDDSYTLIQFSDYDFDPGNTVTAHRYGDTICSYLGLGVFEGVFNASNALCSIATSSTPTVSKTNDQFYAASQVNRTSGHYNQMLPLTWTLYTILLLFEGGDRDTQAKWGAGYTNQTNTTACAVNNNWSATAGWNNATVSTDGTHGVTAGGIQNMWGNVWQFFGEFAKETSNIARFTIKGGSDHALISASAPSTWASVQMTGAADGFVMDIIGNNFMPFLPRTTGGSNTTYWADNHQSSTIQRNCSIIGGRWAHGPKAGVFHVNTDDSVDNLSGGIGSRLQVLME